MASTINASNSGFGGIVSTGDSSGVLTLQSAGTTAVTLDTSQNATFAGKVTSAGALTLASNGTTTAVTIDTSQNVGIGTASPVTKLDVGGQALFQGSTLPSYKGAAIGAVTINNNSADGTVDFTQGLVFSDNSNNFGAWAHAGIVATGGSSYNGNLVFGTDGSGTQTSTITERMRIDSNGTLLVGQITNPATGSVVIRVPNPSGNGVNAQMASNTGTAYPWSNYNASGTYIGGMTSTSSATGFPTSSDKRLKKNIEDAPSAIDKILTAQVVSHDWIDDDAHVEYGFVAQDLQNIIPQAVMEGTDKEDGSINMPWGVDYSKIVPLLTKAIQEQQTIINNLKARIETLESK